MIHTKQSPGYFNLTDTVTGSEHTSTHTLTLRTHTDPEPALHVIVANDDGRTEQASILIFLHDARAIAGFMLQWLADYEG
jgi:hypothetical protein